MISLVICIEKRYTVYNNRFKYRFSTVKIWGGIMAENYNGMAVGVFELDNLVACFVALDAASKAANVKIQGVERNRLKSGACVKMRGTVLM